MQTRIVCVGDDNRKGKKEGRKNGWMIGRAFVYMEIEGVHMS